MSWTDCSYCFAPILSCRCGGQLTAAHKPATVTDMTETTVHETSTEDVIMDCFRPGSETIRYRWVCICGKRGKGTHATQDAALAVSLHHTMPAKTKLPKIKPMRAADKFRRGTTSLAQHGYTRDEIWEMIWDLNAALRQGTGLGGIEMSNIINTALGLPTLEDEARSLFESDPAPRWEGTWDTLPDSYKDEWRDIVYEQRSQGSS